MKHDHGNHAQHRTGAADTQARHEQRQQIGQAVAARRRHLAALGQPAHHRHALLMRHVVVVDLIVGDHDEQGDLHVGGGPECVRPHGEVAVAEGDATEENWATPVTRTSTSQTSTSSRPTMHFISTVLPLPLAPMIRLH